jgi:hypothetical protein
VAARDRAGRQLRMTQRRENLQLVGLRETLEGSTRHGGAEVTTADGADYSDRPERSQVSAEELLQGSAPVRSGEDLAQDGVFDDGELEEFLADLIAMRQADLA